MDSSEERKGADGENPSLINRLGRRRAGNKMENRAKAESSFSITIPEEIVVEIISKLPLKSLSRFTCVSKTWLSLISHISANKTGRYMVLLETTCSICTMDEEYGFERLPRPWVRERHYNSVARPWVKEQHYKPMIRFFGSCNGLLLINIVNDLFLWNPLIRFFKKVLSCDLLGDWFYTVGSGLCYDSATDEYKVVMSFYYESTDYSREFVRVYGLRSKTCTPIHFPYKIRTICVGPVVNGNLHWFVARKKSNDHFLPPHQIIYFNTQRGKFKKVPMPKPKQENGDNIVNLGVLNGCLCMTRWEYISDTKHNLEVLAMKEYGIEKSWTIMFTVSNLAIESYPVGFTKNGEVLMNTRNERGVLVIWVYNPNDNSNRDIYTPTSQDVYYVHPDMYEESLVKPIGYVLEEEEERPLRKRSSLW